MPDISSSLSKREVNARQNTYTKSEIDLKDGAIQAIAEAAQTTADAAEKKNQEQDQLIAELQKSSHSHSNQAVLDKTEQPYTTAERDKLAGLENYTHPTHTANAKGFYKFASDGEGHVTDAEKVTKKDITDLGIPDKDTDTTYKLAINTDGGSGNSKNNTLYLKGSDGSSYSLLFDFADVNNYCHPICKLKKLSDDYFMLTAGVLYAPTEWHFNQNGGDTISVDIGYTDVDGANNHLITDFANDILVHNVVSQNCSTTVTGYQNLVEGNANKVYGNNNLVGGEHNQITEHGCSSVVSGYGLYCDAVNQTVLGRYNTKDTGSVDNAWNSYYGKYVLIIGNGSDSNTGRSNAFAVDWDGNLWCGKDKTSLNAQVASKQDKLTAGTNITISGSTISAKDTTYSDATQSAHGLMTAVDKKKLAGIAAGAEVNQNAFSTIATGSARYAATAKQSAFLIDGDGGTSVSLDTKTGRLTVSSHTHDNKAVLDQLNEEQWKFINGAANKAHVHDNKGTLDKITDVGWNTVYGNTHSHDNKAVLDKTTASYTAADKKKLDSMDLSKYLPKSGGVMIGDIDMATNSKDIVVGSHKSSTSIPTAVAGGTVSVKEPLETGFPKRKSLVGSWLDENSVWHNVLSVRHRNGNDDGSNYGFYLRSLLTSNGSLFWNKQIGAGKWQGERVLLDSTNYSSYAAKSDHTHAMITNSALWVSGANNTAKWVKLGTLVSSGNFSNAMIRVWSGDGANGRANQNSSFEVQIKDGWQSTESATKACGVTVYRVGCSSVKVKVIPTAHDTYTVWAYMPWGYWNGNYAVYGKYKSWTDQHLIQSEEPEGTGADTAYYDQAFLTSTVANATTWDGLINDVDTYNSSDTWILVKKDNRIQHRYAGELDVNSAKTLTDSGWVTCPLAVTGNTTYPSSSSIIKVRKYGKLVRLEAAVKYKTAFGTGHNVATIPEGYRPSVLQREHGITSTATEKIWFDATLGVGGNLSFAPAGNSSYEFNPANSYECRMTYFID